MRLLERIGFCPLSFLTLNTAPSFIHSLDSCCLSAYEVPKNSTEDTVVNQTEKVVLEFIATCIYNAGGEQDAKKYCHLYGNVRKSQALGRKIKRGVERESLWDSKDLRKRNSVQEEGAEGPTCGPGGRP